MILLVGNRQQLAIRDVSRARRKPPQVHDLTVPQRPELAARINEPPLGARGHGYAMPQPFYQSVKDRAISLVAPQALMHDDPEG